MSQLRAIIVDDEKRSRRVLKNLLSDFYPKIIVLDEFPELTTAIAGIKKLKPDVVFLDIQMPQYAGYEIVNFFEDIDFHIVFVTAFDQYALKAFELSALDYLLKPINIDRLELTINRLIENVSLEKKYEKYKVLFKNFGPAEQHKLVIPEVGNRRILNVEDIIAIEADGSYTTFHLVKSESFTASKNVKYFSNLLEDRTCFFRCHRAWLINTNYLRYRNKMEGTLTMEGGLKVKLSRHQIKAFEEEIKVINE
ncbi:response regulator [uncultured Croceitalea sp.]|uniref:LytR/AlgR family response regulator transcription factor n=1 Tax=uncultured Croceitalea sp. TaxID=1798908 RepID=UPI0033059E27